MTVVFSLKSVKCIQKKAVDMAKCKKISDLKFWCIFCTLEKRGELGQL